ncbi:hypothetical protein AB4084_40475, partial [Lysobacter sp. 2RAB21]
AEVERTRIEGLDRQTLDADRRRESLSSERTGLDVAALADAFEQLHSQHDLQKESLDSLSEELEVRKSAVSDLQEQQRSTQN